MPAFCSCSLHWCGVVQAGHGPGLSHRQVLQQGIVQLQQELAAERDAMIEQRMLAARTLFSNAMPCRCY